MLVQGSWKFKNLLVNIEVQISSQVFENLRTSKCRFRGRRSACGSKRRFRRQALCEPQVQISWAGTGLVNLEDAVLGVQHFENFEVQIPQQAHSAQ